MSSPEDAPLTLAELRRTYAVRSRSRTASPVAGLGLFDGVPAPSLPVAPDPETSPAPERAAVETPLISLPQTTRTPEADARSAAKNRYQDLPLTRQAPPLSKEQSQEPQVWTVTALVQRVRSMVEGAYRTVWVEGEISNWRPAGSGHCYFTLKDGNAQLSAVLFRKQAALLRFHPRDGDTVRLRGQLSVYESRGQMQLIGETMEQLGLGALLQATRELKERLRQEGLFARKRPLPSFPRCIGVITSLQGAALRDVVKVCRRRHAAVNLLIYPVAVQGPHCVVQVEAALRWFSAHPERADVVLLARGGGSWEDLHGFDHERVARAIVACTLPVISGIGHATDSTIADAAADVCAPTPSAAAELLTSAQHRVDDQLARLQLRLSRAGRFELLHARQRLAVLGVDRLVRHTEAALGRRAQRLDEFTLRLRDAMQQRANRKGSRLLRAEARLRQLSPALRLSALQLRAGRADAEVRRLSLRMLESRRNRLAHTLARLETLSPLRVLDRGYALVYGPDGRLLRSATEAAAGELIRARLASGTLQARVEPEV